MRCGVATLILVMFGSYSSIAQAQSCLYIPSAESPAVSACDVGENYTFDITGSTYAYAKDAYQARLNGMLADWLAAEGLEAPDGAVVELWLAVPEANPSAAQARAVLRSPSLNLVWFLSVHPDEWTLAGRDIGILAGGAYPQSFGHRPGQLLVKAKGGSEAARAALLAAYGATTPEAYVSGWSIYHTQAAAELVVADSVLADPRSATLIERIDPNSVVEWIAMRQLAFTFAFSPGSP
jgi:hypothetical protein